MADRLPPSSLHLPLFKRQSLGRRVCGHSFLGSALAVLLPSHVCIFDLLASAAPVVQSIMNALAQAQARVQRQGQGTGAGAGARAGVESGSYPPFEGEDEDGTAPSPPVLAACRRVLPSSQLAIGKCSLVGSVALLAGPPDQSGATTLFLLRPGKRAGVIAIAL